jgi:hypothetical protein
MSLTSQSLERGCGKGLEQIYQQKCSYVVRLQTDGAGIIEQVASNKSSLSLKNIVQNKQKLQLFKMILKKESNYKSY